MRLAANTTAAHPIGTIPPLTMAVWPALVTRPLNGMDGWLAAVDEKMAEAKAAGAALLMIPEYACEAWCQWQPAGLTETQSAAWLGEQAPAVVPKLQALVDRHGIALVPGTFPWTVEGELRNRAFFLTPNAEAIVQDKLCPTPGEADSAGMNISAADRLAVFSWRGLNLAILICLDIEQPLLSHELMGKNVDLILCPSMTSKLSGYTRVHRCAAARAVELFTAVAVVGAVGSVLDAGNTGGGALYLPSEVAYGMTGDFVKSGPIEGEAGIDDLILIADIPLDSLRAGRTGAAEVWPGSAWPAKPVQVVD